jgi:hypothetical protein
MVGDEREVVVLTLPADLVDPDLKQSVEPIGIKLIVADALDDPPDRIPVDPQHPLDRRLIGPSGQPGDQAFEVAREVRSGPGEGTPSVRAPCTGHHRRRRRRRQRISSRHTPRSRCRQTESTGRLSLRAIVEYPHFGQTSRRRRNATSTTTRSRSKRTFFTSTPLPRRRSLENAAVTRTLSLLASR